MVCINARVLCVCACGGEYECVCVVVIKRCHKFGMCVSVCGACECCVCARVLLLSHTGQWGYILAVVVTCAVQVTTSHVLDC